MNRISSTVVMALASSMASIFAHTPAQTNAIVRGALFNFISYSSKRLADLPREVSPTEVPDNWCNFLGGYTNDGWTLEEKKAAFEWYLGTLGTNDCVAMSGEDRNLVRAALIQCKSLHHTNCVPAMRALALNPRGIFRTRAIALAIEFGTVDSGTTTFVEAIMTNSTDYILSERKTASAKYAGRLLAFNATNAVQLASREAGVRMLYRNRLLESGTSSMIDKAFLKYIDGYVASSNRLTYAINAFSYPACASIFGDYFTSVTNQLLSSGQPLIQLDIDVGGIDAVP